MGIILRRFYIPLIFFIVIIEATDSDNNGTSSNVDRQSRASGRIVKLYSGTKPEPIICTGEGFQKDPHNCAIFYRCMKSGNGKYTVFRFQCGPGTVYDPDTEVCNHPRSTKRSECGGFLGPVEYTTHMNEIEGMQNEIPSPIVTNRPIYIASTTTLKSTTMTTAKFPSSSDSTYSTPPHLSSLYPWGSSISNIYINNGAMAYPLKPTSVTMSPFTSSHETFTITPSTTSNIPHTHSRDNICTSDGFMGDSQNCRKFYRCVANQRGGYTTYEFSCTETTIWDEDNQICNHVWAVKRSRCGYRIDKNASTNTLLTSDKVHFQEKDSTKHQNIRGNKSNSTIQQQLQISYGSKVTQTQTQISNGSVVQNQTQIHYGDRINQDKVGKSHQNQTQVSHGSAVSQSQTQIAHGNKGVQTQLQVDHSNKASQSQIQINELSKATTTSAIHVSTEISNTQKNNECTELGYMGDINDCQKFYRCIDNGRGGYIKYEFSCSEGTVWDQNIKACNHAWAVKECGSKTTTNPTTHTFTASTYKTTLNYHTTSSTENYPIKPESEDTEDNKDIGYQNPILMSTSSTLSSTTSTTTTISMAMDDSKKSGNCTSSGFMGDDNDCKIFYRCVENGNGGYVTHQFKCGEGTVWDSEIGACNHAWAVKKCGGSAAAEVPETTTKKLTTSPAFQPSSTILTTSTENYQTRPEIVDTAIDEDSGYHIPEQMPTSSSTSTTITSTEKGGSKGSECTSSGFMGDDNNCKIFFRCVENGNGGYVKFEFKCGEGTVWDPEIGACNHAWAVKKCGGGASLDITEIDKTTKEITTSSSIPFSSSTATQSTTQMSSTIDYTDAHDAGYGPPHSEISTITSSHRPPQDVTQQNIICTSSGFIGDKNDCKKFYRCVDNGEGGYISYEFTCSEGTVWDSNIDACNHNWAVDSCGESATASNIQGTVSSTTTEFTKNMSTSTPGVTITTTEITSTGSNDCTQSGYMRDAKNCKKFYRCVDNGDGSYIKYEYSCGEGTLWDQEIEACNHAWAVTTCNSSVESPSEEYETTSEVHSPINDDIDNGYLSNIDTDSDINISDQTSTTEVSKESGQSGSCINSGFIGDKNNCKKFYRCVDDGNGGFIRYEFNCGEGTVWDQSIEACNHAWAVKECNTGNNTTSIPNDSTISTTEAVTPTSQKYPQVTESTSNTGKENNFVCSEDGFIGDLNNCKIFYRCVDDGKGGFTKYEFSCGEGTYWNQEILSCDHITSDKECGKKGSHTTSKVPQYEHDEIQTETTTASKDENYSTQKPPVSSETCTAEGFYGDQKDCKKFYRCVDNGEGGYSKFDFTCGDGSIWDQDLQTCNHESDKNKCSSTSSGSPQATTGHTQHGDDTTIRTTTEKKHTSTSSSSTSINELKCDTEGFFADPNDCRIFIRCVKDDKDGFTKHQFTCAEGTVWVQEMLTCDHDTGESQCSSQTVTKPVASEHNQQTTEKSELSTTGHIQGNNQDDKYNTSIVEPSPESNICSSEGYYGNKNDCAKFYRCVDNGNGGYTTYEFTCSDGTAWDSNIQACNHIDEVPSCQGSVLHDEDNTPTTQISSTSSQTSSSATTSSTTQKPTDASKPSSESITQNSQKPETCDSDGYFGNTQDCKKFYRCVDNGNGGYTKYDFTCAEGTIWDQDLTICNHPGDVVNSSCNSTDDGNTTEDSTSDNSSSGGSSSSTTQSTTEGQNQDVTSNKPDSNNVNCTKAGFYSNPNDCKKFYRCVDWDGDGSRFSVYHFECGEGTIWDPAIETCNHEESVYPPRNCSGSQTQGESQSSTTQTTTTTQEETTSESTTIKTIEQSPTSSESTTSTTTEQFGNDTTARPAENTTEQSGESTTKTPEESTTEKLDEGTTEKQPESTTVKSSEGTTEKTNESTTQQLTEGTTEKPNQSTTEQSGEGTTEKQGESTTEQSGEGTSEQTGQSTTEKPGESTTEKSGESTTERSSEGTTEQPGESTTAQTTEGTSEKSEDGTTEQTAGSTTEQTDGTTQGTNTESSTSGQSTTEESSTEKSTTESVTDESSITESGTDSSTNENSGNKECPETEEDQYLFVCPSSFRRHPKYCNLFYQCDENEETRDLKIAVFTCPNGTIYDESQTKCVEESKADKECEGEIAQNRRVKRRNRIGENDPIVVGKDSHNCPAAGYYAFEKDGDCSPGFLKCKRNKSNKLRAFIYQCPQGYIFWSVSRRCEPMHRVRDCRRSVLNSWSERWEIPIENRNVAWT